MAHPPVLYVVHQHDYSGAEVMHLPLMREDADPLLACPPDSRTAELFREAGVTTVPLPFRSLRHSAGPLETLRSLGRGVLSVRELRRILRAHPERRIVYCISLRPGMLTSLAALGQRRRAVWFVSDFAPPEPLGFLARLLAVIGCERAIATSRAVHDSFVDRWRTLARRTSVVYPGVELDRFSPQEATPGRPLAAVVGHVSPTKRTDLALDVAARVGRRVPDFAVEVIGRAQYRQSDFEFEEALHRRVESDHDLARHVRFRGYATDMPSELRRFGLLLHCRPDEPFGVALIEAMAAGLPVVAPGAAGPAEIVEHGKTGLLYAPGDAEEASRHVLRILEDESAARAMGAAARAAVEERFSTAAQVRLMRQAMADAAAT